MRGWSVLNYDVSEQFYDLKLILQFYCLINWKNEISWQSIKQKGYFSYYTQLAASFPLLFFFCHFHFFFLFSKASVSFHLSFGYKLSFHLIFLFVYNYTENFLCLFPYGVCVYVFFTFDNVTKLCYNYQEKNAPDNYIRFFFFMFLLSMHFAVQCKKKFC